MRVTVLGGNGMLGHKFLQVFRERFETSTTVRRGNTDLPPEITSGVRLVEIADVNDAEDLVVALAATRPDVVVNAVGIVKQSTIATDASATIATNGILPHRLARLGAALGFRLIHISTDCVFSGRRGGYSEDDLPDAPDLYGRSKMIGEIADDRALTLRTSIIGRELRAMRGLVEWFLSNEGGRTRGFSRAIYTGLPTVTLAAIVAELIERHPRLTGLYNVASAPIDKCSLLHLVNRAFGVRIEIEPYDGFVKDMSLDGRRFASATGIVIDPWPALVDTMASDATHYRRWRGANATD